MSYLSYFEEALYLILSLAFNLVALSEKIDARAASAEPPSLAPAGHHWAAGLLPRSSHTLLVLSSLVSAFSCSMVWS